MKAIKSFPDDDKNGDDGDDEEEDDDNDDGDGMRGHSEAFIPLACCPL